MSFAEPLWLLVAALALPIVALHIRRRRNVPVGSVQIGRLLQAGGALPRTVKPPPVTIYLVLQILAVILAALALAGPRLGETPPAHRVFLLDASASMTADDADGTRFAAARAALAEALAETPPSAESRVSIIVAAATPDIVAARLDEAGTLDERIAGLQPTEGEPDWARVADYVAAVGGGDAGAEIVVLTDGGDAAAAAPLGATPPTIWTFGDAATANAGIEAALAPTLDEDGAAIADSWTITGTLRLAGDAAPPVTMLFEPAGTQGALDFGTIEPTPIGDGIAEFAADLVLPVGGALTLALPADAAPFDDTVSFVVDAGPRVARILYVGAGSEPLLRALRAVPSTDVAEFGVLPENAAAYDLVVVDGVSVARHPGTSTLWIGPPRLDAGAAPAIIADPSPTGWRGDHPLAAAVDWAAIEPSTAYSLPVVPGADVLLQAGAEPLVTAATLPTGRDVMLAFHPVGSGWADTAGFPLFVSNLVRWAVPDLGATVATSCTVGAACALGPLLLTGTVTAPDGSVAALDPSLGAFTPLRSGIYRVEAGERVAAVAVNAPTAERADADPSIATAEPGSGQVELWRWLAAAVLVALLVEGWLAGRGPDRFLQPSALSRANPLYGRRRAVLALRVAVLVLVGAAVAGVALPLPGQATDVVLVVEAPADADAAAEDAALLANARDTAGAAGRGERLGLVEVGTVPRVAGDLGTDSFVRPAGASVGTDVEAALRLAAAMVTPGENGRIVLAADGVETGGDLFAALPALQRSGVAVDFVEAGGPPPGDVLVQSVEVPDRVFAGEAFPLDAIIVADRDAAAEIEILRDGVVIATRSVDLLAGQNRISAEMPPSEAGAPVYEVSVAAAGDPFPADDRTGVRVDVVAEPLLAIVTPEQAAGEQMGAALAVHGMTPIVIPPEAAPTTIDGWLAYDAVVMMNTPALALTSSQQNLLADMVEDHGRGLMLLGGANTFGPGGYFETALERVSPLSARVPRETPETLLLFVLDRSGSMRERVNGRSRLDIAREAASAAIGLLDQRTQVGIVVFDTEASILMPPQQRPQPAELGLVLDRLRPGGGTSIAPGLLAAADLLELSTATERHIVVMTDGMSQTGDFEVIIDRITALGATISSVGIGEDADAERLALIAERGGGAFHLTTDFEALPSILSREALLLAGSPVEERTVLPRWADRDAPFLAGLPDAMPAVYGYVLTTPKDEADVHLTVQNADGETSPLLASWRVGSGRVVALSTEGAGAWATDMMAMTDYPRLWAQAARWVLSDAQGPGLHVAFEQRGDAATVTVDALDAAGVPQPGLAITAELTRPGAAGPETLALAEMAPGRYVGAFRAAEPGDYAVTAMAEGGSAVGGLHVGYPARFQFGRADVGRIAALAEASGGRVTTADAPLFGDGETRWDFIPMWRPFLAAGIAVLMIELVLRYAPALLQWRRRRATPRVPSMMGMAGATG